MLGQAAHGQTVQAEVLQHGVGPPPLRPAARYHVCQVEVELVVVQDLRSTVTISVEVGSTASTEQPHLARAHVILVQPQPGVVGPGLGGEGGPHGGHARHQQRRRHRRPRPRQEDLHAAQTSLGRWIDIVCRYYVNTVNFRFHSDFIMKIYCVTP